MASQAGKPDHAQSKLLDGNGMLILPMESQPSNLARMMRNPMIQVVGAFLAAGLAMGGVQFSRAAQMAPTEGEFAQKDSYGHYPSCDNIQTPTTWDAFGRVSAKLFGREPATQIHCQMDEVKMIDGHRVGGGTVRVTFHDKKSSGYTIG